MRFQLAACSLSLILCLASGSDARAQAKIIGGDVSTEGAYPWMAALVDDGRAPANGTLCGGMLVAPQWVLTAAHCVEGENRNTLDVWVGLWNLNVTGGAQKRNIQAIYRHPNYRVDRNDNLFYDIALILLDRPVTGIAPVPMASTASHNDPGSLVRALGWGTLDPVFDVFPLRLWQVDMQIVDIADAQADYQNTLGPTHLAAGGDGVRDTCAGDSGGPLFRIISGNPVLVGIVSFGDGCALPDIEGIYTNVLTFRPWIDARLILTAQPPDLSLLYKSRAIAKADLSPAPGEGTHFGRTRGGGRGKTRSYRIRNSGAGLLTAGNLRVSGAIFNVLKQPPLVISPGGNPLVKINFSPRRRGTFTSMVRLTTNDPDDPLFWFRIRGKGR